MKQDVSSVRLCVIPSELFLPLKSATLLKSAIDASVRVPDGKKNRFVLNNKIEIKIRYKKRHSKPCGQTWPVIRFRLSALLHGQNKLKAPNYLIHCTGSS